ncbi:MAG: hypothetical protein M1831_002012 [Alyxoria varia]|nr:MAG: hypothetical protein M1831_002012 [Alyxoria varia]
MTSERLQQAILPGLAPHPGRLSALTYHEKPQPLCGDREGWGPLSPSRFDFTPCFLDVWIVVVSAYGVVFGAGAIYYLHQKRKPEPVAKNWHFYAKLIVLGSVSITTALQAALQIQYYEPYWPTAFRFWASIATLSSLAVIFAVQYLEHQRSRVPNGVVLFYWLFFIIVHAIKIRSLISLKFPSVHVAYFSTFCVTTGLASCEFVLEWLVPKKLSAYSLIGDVDKCPYDNSTVFSVLAFSWMTPLMKYGYNHYLTQEDLWNMRKRDTASTTHEQFEEAWEAEKERKSPSLWLALFRGFGGPFFRGSIFKTGSDCLAFVQPQLLRLLIAFVDSYRTPEPQTVARGAAIALAMFTVSVSQTVCLHQYFGRAFETGMRVKAGLTSAIYAKSMRLSSEGRVNANTGEIVNYMAVDSVRLQDLSQYGQMLWSAPLQIVLCMISLYQLVGLPMLAGVGAMILMIPTNALMAKAQKSFQKRQMANKDSRSRLMTEILGNMKSIKLYAWTTAFMKKLNAIRNDQELTTLRKIGALQAFANFTWSTTPFLVSCSTFAVFVLTQDRPLTTELVFPALALFNLLTFPLSVLPIVITSIVEASVAINRLSKYLLADELQPDAVIKSPAADELGEESVRITNASFTWNKFADESVLEDIDFYARKGDLTCIVGRVGAGKSSLLEAMLGNLYKRKGIVHIRGAVAYVAQNAWVMNASVRENVLFGHKWDGQFYEKTIKACALIEDFASLPDGDKTQVGERGISLSGGQKARLTLARAVYARADVYILDDILSAVDQHVARHLTDHVLGSKGLLGGKTKVLATNAVPVLHEASNITFIGNGRILETGTLEKLMTIPDGHITQVVHTTNDEGFGTNAAQGNSNAERDNTSNDSPLIEEVESEEDKEVAESPDGIPGLVPIRPAQSSIRKTSSMTLRKASTASFQGPRGKVNEDEEFGNKSGQTKETSEQGKVQWSVYAEYAKTSNLLAVAFYLVFLLGAQTAQMGGNVWLERWSEANASYGGNTEVGKYLGIYFAFGIGSAVLVVFQTLILWIFCSIEASRKLHERMAIAIFRSPMSFFETTPAGRILNRFSSDIYRVDEILARTFNMLFVNSARALFTLAVICVSTPIFVAMIIPLAFLYLYIQRYYLRTSRELKRLDSVSRSPIYAHFQESLAGLSTIRAFRQQSRFSLENEWRVDANLRAYFPSISANRWLAIRLEFLGSIIILAAAGFSIISVVQNTGLSAGLVGLAMSYALQITQSLNWIVRQTVEVETNIVSVERILEYARLPSEAPEILPNRRPPISWPVHGEVSFKDYSTRYRANLDPVLKQVNLTIRPREKIGVVGRTGAGKSSLTLALFRIIEPSQGHVEIDGLNTSSIGLLDLRRRLAIIPQDASLFEGTVRDNLDPGHVYDDTELYSVLEHAHLKDHVSSMSGKLDARIQEGGSNLSQGQRQLISLARALLTPSNILVLDEATAAVDVQTDATVQTTLRSNAFKDRTIIAIAHRINTILDSDRIVVLEKGRVAEFDTPAALIEKKGLFYHLCKEAKLLDQGLTVK